jgi:hypothetical protein
VGVDRERELGEDAQRAGGELAHVVTGDVSAELAADHRGDLVQRHVAVREQQRDQRGGQELVVAGGGGVVGEADRPVRPELVGQAGRAGGGQVSGAGPARDRCPRDGQRGGVPEPVGRTQPRVAGAGDPAAQRRAGRPP